jgi:hypothetical protein
MVSSGLLRRVALVRTDVSEEPGASFLRSVTTQKTPFFIENKFYEEYHLLGCYIVWLM